MLQIKKYRQFANGIVYALNTQDGWPIETTDTFLPYYTKDAIGRKQNNLTDKNIGSRSERWMIGVSVMSGCPVGCKFCATGTLPRWRNLSAQEIVDQVMFIIGQNPQYNPVESQEFKINYTRMGEPFLNIDAVKEAIYIISEKYPNAHHYISTIGIKDSDFSWVKDNITLQISLHSLDEDRRNDLIPFIKKMNIGELGNVRTQSNLKTTLNLTLVSLDDFDVNKLKQNFCADCFFVKLSPINTNAISSKNNLGDGVIVARNLV